jgi:hypothetical protein
MVMLLFSQTLPRIINNYIFPSDSNYYLLLPGMDLGSYFSSYLEYQGTDSSDTFLAMVSEKSSQVDNVQTEHSPNKAKPKLYARWPDPFHALRLATVTSMQIFKGQFFLDEDEKRCVWAEGEPVPMVFENDPTNFEQISITIKVKASTVSITRKLAPGPKVLSLRNAISTLSINQRRRGSVQWLHTSVNRDGVCQGDTRRTCSISRQV